MSLSHGILGFLTYSGMTGYDLAKSFDSSVSFFWHAQNSHIYLELGKLERRGFVACERIQQTDKPNKKLYTITDAGREEFLRWLAEGGAEEALGGKNAFLMRVFFSGNVSPEQSIAMLRRFADDAGAYVAGMSGIPQNIEKYGAYLGSYKSLYWQFTADFGRSYMAMCVEWAESCIKRLEELL